MHFIEWGCEEKSYIFCLQICNRKVSVFRYDLLRKRFFLHFQTLQTSPFNLSALNNNVFQRHGRAGPGCHERFSPGSLLKLLRTFFKSTEELGRAVMNVPLPAAFLSCDERFSSPRRRWEGLSWTFLSRQSS